MTEFLISVDVSTKPKCIIQTKGKRRVHGFIDNVMDITNGKITFKDKGEMELKDIITIRYTEEKPKAKSKTKSK